MGLRCDGERVTAERDDGARAVQDTPSTSSASSAHNTDKATYPAHPRHDNTPTRRAWPLAAARRDPEGAASASESSDAHSYHAEVSEQFDVREDDALTMCLCIGLLAHGTLALFPSRQHQEMRAAINHRAVILKPHVVRHIGKCPRIECATVRTERWNASVEQIVIDH